MFADSTLFDAFELYLELIARPIHLSPVATYYRWAQRMRRGSHFVADDDCRLSNWKFYHELHEIDGYSSDIPNVVTGSVANTSFQRHATNICTDYLPTRRNKQLPQSKTTRPPTPPHPHSTLDETTHNNRASNISIRSTSVSVWFSHEEIFQRGKVTIHSSFLSNCQCPSYSITTKKVWTRVCVVGWIQ